MSKYQTIFIESNNSKKSPLKLDQKSIFQSRDYSNETRIIGNHSLLANTSMLNTQQIHSVLENLFEQASKIIKKEKGREELKKEWEINCVSQKGYSYIWIVDSRFYHLILGRNSDGSTRAEKKMIWTPEQKEYYESREEFFATSESLYMFVNRKGDPVSYNIKKGEKKQRSWFEVEEEREMFEKEYKNVFLKEVQIPSLLIVPPISLNNSETHIIEFDASHLSVDKKKSIPKELICTYLPNINEKDPLWKKIKEEMTQKFSMFVEKRGVAFEKRLYRDEDFVKSTYPYVQIHNPGRRGSKIIVYFSENLDARWALTMTKKLRLNCLKQHIFSFDLNIPIENKKCKNCNREKCICENCKCSFCLENKEQ